MTFFTIALLLGLAVLVSGFPRPAGHGAGIFRDTSGGQGLYGFRNSGGSPNNGGNSILVSSLGNTNGRGISTGNRANINYGPGIFRDQFGGEYYNNFGNWDFGHTGRHSDSLNNGGSFVSDRSVGNFNRNGISTGNRENIYDGSQSIGNNFGNWDFGHTGRHSDSLNNGGSFVSDRSVGNFNRNGISSGNRANIYDGSRSIGNNFGNWDFGHTGRHSDSLNNGGSFVSDRSVDIISGRGISSGNRANIYDVSGSAANGQPGKVAGDIFRNFGRDGIQLGGFLSFE